MSRRYEEEYEESIHEPEKFWGEAAQEIQWYRPYTKVLDDTLKPFYRWFVGGELNTCYNAVDYHVLTGRGKQLALIYDSPVTNTIRKITYQELLNEVSKFAGVLSSFGVIRGDRVIIYMPSIPETAMAMLACSRIGAIHSVVFGGFESNELAKRIDDAKPKLILAASCGIKDKRTIQYKPLLDKAIEISNHKPEKCIIYQRNQALATMIKGRDVDWEEVMANSSPVDCLPVSSTDPLYILYTSGTTGVPKGIVRDNGGHAAALKWSMKNVYGMEPGEVYWAASDMGWVVGHSFILYGPLLHGCTTIMYEGNPVGTPDPGSFWRVISKHNVKLLFTAPSTLRSIKKEDPKGDFIKKYDLSNLKYLFLVGERLDPDTYYWVSHLLKKPIIDHWWQTETGWPVAANCVGLEPFPIKAGSPTKPVPGYRVEILDSGGKVLPPETEGIVTMRLPLPPGTLMTLWGKDAKFKMSYLDVFPGNYYTGDGGYFDKEGYLFITGRVDDVINVAGHRLSTGAIEDVLSEHPDVAECAVVGKEDDLKGQIPLGFFVLKSSVQRDPKIIIEELVQMVREQIGAFACFNQGVVVRRLPKTRSGKILRPVMRKIADGEVYSIPSTIDDPIILAEIEEALKFIKSIG